MLYPLISHDCLLLLDSWSGETNFSIYYKIFIGNIKCEQRQILPRTSGDIQPLDRYFFVTMRIFLAKKYDRVAIDDIDIDIFFLETIF